MKLLYLWTIFFAFASFCFLFGCASYQQQRIQEIQMPNKESPFQTWLIFYEEQFRLNGDNTPMPPSDAPEVAWQAYSTAKNNYMAEKASKKVEEQAIAGIFGTLAGILVVTILMQMGK